MVNHAMAKWLFFCSFIGSWGYDTGCSIGINALENGNKVS